MRRERAPSRRRARAARDRQRRDACARTSGRRTGPSSSPQHRGLRRARRAAGVVDPRSNVRESRASRHRRVGIPCARDVERIADCAAADRVRRSLLRHDHWLELDGGQVPQPRVRAKTAMRSSSPDRETAATSSSTRRTARTRSAARSAGSRARGRGPRRRLRARVYRHPRRRRPASRAQPQERP